MAEYGLHRTKANILSGIEGVVFSRKIANNTVRYKDEKGNVCIRLHDTNIIRQTKRGTVVFDSGGFKTPTTKERINTYTPVPISVFQEKGSWFLREREGQERVIPFFDGIETDAKGNILEECFDKATKRQAHDKKLLYLINQYCKAIRQLDKMPLPNEGDCWFCSMFKMGNNQEDAGHLISHLEETYIHGSLIVNAFREVGITDIGIQMICYSKRGPEKKRICQVVRRYFKKKLGLAA